MKIAFYHGYELTGSGSNEYTRYLARAVADQGHDVVVLCCDPHPEAYSFVARCYRYDEHGNRTILFSRSSDGAGTVTLHCLPHRPIYPVFITDKQREGRVRRFVDLSEDELLTYHRVMQRCVRSALHQERPAVMHANHLVWQPVVAAEVCPDLGIPFYVVPHGSSIEYVVKCDSRFHEAAEKALLRAAGFVWIASGVRERVLSLYPAHVDFIESRSAVVGVGVDTALFTPADRAQRSGLLKQVTRDHPTGGKTPAQRRALSKALVAGDLHAVRRYWDAYDYDMPDQDLPDQLSTISPDADVLLYVGALTWGKGVHELIAAMPEIAARRPEVRLLIVGSGSYREVLEGLVSSVQTANQTLFDELVSNGRALDREGVPGALDELSHYVSDPEKRDLLFRHGADLVDRVLFTGRLDHARLRWLFPCCDLAVFPSIVEEASPLVLVEAMANGVPPLAAYHSGLKDGLDSLESGLPNDVWRHLKIDPDPTRRVSSIVDGVCWLLEHNAKKTIGGGLRCIAEEKHDWTSVAQALMRAAGRFATSTLPG